MSLPEPSSFSIPETTARVAHLAFRQPSAVMRLRDELGVIYRDEDFAELFSTQGQPALSPGRLALVTVMQYMEGLSDRQAADAVRSRIDWKYALGLDLEDGGFDYSVLSEFRRRLLDGGQAELLLGQLLALCEEHQLLGGRKTERTDSTEVEGAVRSLNRLEMVIESVRHALNEVAQLARAWLRAQVTPDWFARYGPRVSDYRLPAKATERAALAIQVGEDGYHLLHQLYATAPPTLWELDSVQALRQIWLQQYYRTEGAIRWREQEEMPPGAKRICSPHDLAVRASQKRSVEWVGYKVHLTETCDPDAPHLIVHVQTTASTEPDATTLPAIHDALAEKGLLPQTHLVDSGYVSAAQLGASQQQQVDLVAPIPAATGWQARHADGYSQEDFTIDFAAEQATCPHGKTSTVWSEGQHRNHPVIRVRFDRQDCLACPVRNRCTTAQTTGRSLQFYPAPQHEALRIARQREQTPEFRQTYAARAGIEGTIAQAVRTDSLRQARYVGLAKTHLQQIFTAVAVNFARLADWFSPDYRRAQTTVSPFVAFCGAT